MNKSAIIITLIIFGCGTTSKDKITEERADTVTAPTPALEVTTANRREDFDKFFEKFQRDSLFQVQRVKFPWRYFVPDEDRLKLVEETEQKDWRHLTFHYADSFATMKVDAYTREIRNDGDTVRLELRGVDNGIFTNYVFVNEHEKWYFISCEDYSN